MWPHRLIHDINKPVLKWKKTGDTPSATLNSDLAYLNRYQKSHYSVKRQLRLSEKQIELKHVLFLGFPKVNITEIKCTMQLYMIVLHNPISSTCRIVYLRCFVVLLLYGVWSCACDIGLIIAFKF